MYRFSFRYTDNGNNLGLRYFRAIEADGVSLQLLRLTRFSFLSTLKFYLNLPRIFGSGNLSVALPCYVYQGLSIALFNIQCSIASLVRSTDL